MLITSGSGQAIDLINQVLLEPGDTVILEEFTYGGYLTKLRRLGVNIVVGAARRGRHPDRRARPTSSPI